MIGFRLQQRLAGALAYAYKTLLLFFFFVFLVRFLTREGGWINWFIVFLILSCPLALVLFRRNVGRIRGTAR